MLFNETFFGLILHNQLKRWPAFQYPEERADFVVPDHFKPGYHKEDDSPPTSMTDSHPYLVDWEGSNEEDPDSPIAWSSLKKTMFVSQLMLLTTSVYMGSSIVSPGIPLLAEQFHVGEVPATLSLTLFVLGYAIGPMIGLCSASEIPAIGRCKPYIITLFLFVLFQIPTALVSNFAAYLFFRFMAGLVGSPPLATGGASVGDVFAPTKAPLALGLWGLSASAGPVLGPIIGAFAAQGFGYDWRWTIWPLLMLSGFTLILLTFSMPESSATNILHRRAERLRQVSGNPHLRSKGEIFAATLTGKEIAMMTFVRPFRLGLFEPIALSINLHIGMVYGVLYVWFEAFPLVFAQTYGFSLGVSTLPFLGILVGNLITYYIFFLWFTKYYRPKLIASKGAVAPEYWLHPAMVGAIFLPLSLFAFGWTSNRSIHWIVPVISSGLFSVGIFGLFTSGLNYLAVSYPDYLASVFSANDFTRGMIGAGLPLVARAMFNNLQANGPKAFPVSWGCTLLGCVSTLLAPVPYLLYFYGPALRKASKFAKDPSEGASKEDDEESNQGQSQQEKSPRREESTPSEQSVQSERSA